MNRKLLVLFMLALMLQTINADDLSISSELHVVRSLVGDAPLRSELRGYMTIYIENLIPDTIAIPTNGFEPIVSCEKGQVKVVLFFPKDDRYNGKRIVRSLDRFNQVWLKEGEVAEIKMNFLWPFDEKGEYKLLLDFKIDDEAAKPYGFRALHGRSECKATSVGSIQTRSARQ